MDSATSWDLGLKTVGTLGGAFIALKAISEWRESRAQRARDLSWKRSKEAYSIIDEMLRDPLSKKALYMLDWEKDYQLPNNTTVFVSRNDVLTALRVHETENFDEKEVMIRDCFDELFNHMERMEHALTIELVEQFALAAPLKYYVDSLARDKAVFQDFLRFYGYTGTLGLLRRYDSWNRGANE